MSSMFRKWVQLKNWRKWSCWPWSDGRKVSRKYVVQNCMHEKPKSWEKLQKYDIVLFLILHGNITLNRYYKWQYFYFLTLFHNILIEWKDWKSSSRQSVPSTPSNNYLTQQYCSEAEIEFISLGTYFERSNWFIIWRAWFGFGSRFSWAIPIQIPYD